MCHEVQCSYRKACKCRHSQVPSVTTFPQAALYCREQYTREQKSPLNPPSSSIFHRTLPNRGKSRSHGRWRECHPHTGMHCMEQGWGGHGPWACLCYVCNFRKSGGLFLIMRIFHRGSSCLEHLPHSTALCQLKNNFGVAGH